jgi:hypothetical protein
MCSTNRTLCAGVLPSMNTAWWPICFNAGTAIPCSFSSL